VSADPADPVAIAASLAPKERLALLWLRPNGSWREKKVGRGGHYLSLWELERLIRDEQPVPLVESRPGQEYPEHRLTPLGRQVRAVLEENGGRLIDW
jgi:hypothetical protein